MNKSAKSEGGRKAGGAGQLWLRLPGLVGEALYETVIGVGLACVDEVLEAERAALSGARSCREHKRRNVTDALPERPRAVVRTAMNQAYATPMPTARGACSAISRPGSSISIPAPLPRCARGWKKL